MWDIKRDEVLIRDSFLQIHKKWGRFLLNVKRNCVHFISGRLKIKL